ncbi:MULTISPECIES: non-ribosomal peptide synthetase [Streptomyces]|uniref:non-ribosomal peptide synthetase n=1 Tax=Streptomyces lycopersici TaxID=2974589 RepID=UPI0021D3BDCF|nr:non-ribosomal peptide synthetase [Streptomyces sp. NEAU-383]
MASDSPRPRPVKPAFAASRTRRQRRKIDEGGISRADRNGPLPASFSQQRLWLMQQLAPDSNSYNLPLVQRLRGALDTMVLRRALGLVASRHEALRTAFDAEDGEPLQRIQPADVVCLRELDARDEDHAQALVRRETAEPFDLHAGPVMRALLVRLADDDHVLALTVHHIAGDGWSLAILRMELSAQYAALLRGAEADLPALPSQYADFAQWERKALSGTKLQKRLDYWQENLRDAPMVLGLPADRPRPPVGSSDAGTVAWCPPTELVTAAKELSRSTGTTLFMSLLAAFQVVLSRYARTDDVLVGTPIANRNHAEVEGLIGMFVNTVVLRGDLSGDPTFRELLLRTRTNAMGAFANAELPFDLLVEKVAPQRDLSANPVVQVLFQLMPLVSSTLSLPGVAAEPFDMNQFFTRMDLEFHVYEDPAGDRLTGEVWYSRALFDEARIKRMLDQFTLVLRGVLDNPDDPISQISLASEVDTDLPTVESNETDRALPFDSLPELLADAAARNPDAIAVVDERVTLTYAELGGRANKMAHLLRHRGVRPGELVGLCIDRGADMIVGMLGILKAGAAYVPIDPEHPIERTRFVLNDSNISTVIAQEEYRARFSDVRDIILPDDPGLESQPASAPDVTTDRNSLAYAIYTSGSTGRPKAVLMPGICVVNLLLWQERTMGREPASRTAQFITATFDYSVQEIFSALLGGTLVIPPDDIRLDPARLAQWIDDSRITRIYAPTTVLRALVEHVDPHGTGLSTLRHLCQGGEALVLDGKLREVCLHRPQLRVHNHYGPAESQLVTGYTLPEDVSAWPATAPIGKPIDNTRIHLLDDALRPVPDGVPAQVCISGIGLARGYLARPELTQQRFITEGTGSEPRMYLSGDLARRLPDGNLEFLGRIDDQVKIRGIRIELGEIETILNEHAAITQAAVTVREDDRGDKRLVAYVVPHSDGRDLAVELRGHVEARLPSYMVPSAFIVLDKLPLTTSGKTDRRALPTPESWSPAPTLPVSPRDATESTVCGIYADVLDVQTVGVHDDFFALGGHSLLASRAVSRIRAELGCDLPLRTLFDARTPALLAQAIGSMPSRDVPVLTAAARTTPAPISLAQQQLLMMSDSLLDLGAFPVCPYGFRLRGEIDRGVLDSALTRIVARHEPLRTGFRDDGDGFVQIVREPTPVRAEFIEVTGKDTTDREAAAVEAAAEIAKNELERPFDLVDGILLRAVLLRLEKDDHILVLMLHHIAGDGWSFDVLVRELSMLYTELAGGPAARLAEVGTTYSDFALWEHKALSGPIREEHDAYWREHLKDAVALELPTDRPRKFADPIGKSLEWTVSPEATSAARRLAQAEGVTLFETMLGAFALAAAGASGLDDILVATPFANRGRPEIDHLIGFFAKVAALRIDLSDDPTFREVLRRVQTAVLGAHAHQDLPYAAMQATSSELPQPLVQFQLISSLTSDLVLPGITSGRFGMAEADLGVGNGELAIWLFDDDSALHGTVVFDGSLFDPARIQTLLSSVESTLHVVSATPSVRVSKAYAANGHARR